MMKMKLNEAPFAQIKNGEKTVELRLNDEKRSTVNVGDEIKFVLATDDTQLIRARVIALHKYASFRELFEAGFLESTGFGGYTVDMACERMRAYYTAEQEQKYGALGIEIELI